MQPRTTCPYFCNSFKAALAVQTLFSNSKEVQRVICLSGVTFQTTVSAGMYTLVAPFLSMKFIKNSHQNSPV